MASFLQRDSSRLFLKLLRMFQNAFAALGTQPEDFPCSRTGADIIFPLLLWRDKSIIHFLGALIL